MRIGMIIALAVCAALMALLFVRFGAELHFSEGKTQVCFRFGPFRKTIPTDAGDKKPKKKKSIGKKSKKKKKKTKPHFRAADFSRALYELLPGLKRAFHQFGRSLIVQPLDMTVVIGKGDPCETAKTYGYVSAGLYILLPMLEDYCTVKEPCVRLDMDLDAEATIYTGTLGITMQIGSFLAFLPMLLLPVLRWYRAVEQIPVKENNTSVPPTEEKGEPHGEDSRK